LSALVTLESVGKVYEQAGRPLPVLEDVDLTLERGESLSIMGPSGCGKSTLLHLLGTLDEPSAGTITIDDRDPFSLTEPELAKFRNEMIGFVFQDHHLLPQYSVLENVMLPAHAFPISTDREPRARELLDRVGLADRLDHRPAALSGGERQRTALARALINAPPLLLCDEPTGNLDEDTAEAVAELLFELHDEAQTVMVVVTHSAELGAKCVRKARLRNRRLDEGGGETGS